MNGDWTLPTPLLQAYQDKEQWYGSSYDLSMAYDHTALSLQDRNRLQRLLWQHSSLVGVVDEQKELGLSWKNVATHNFKQFTFGLLQLEGGEIAGCMSYFLDRGNTTWFALSIPLTILGMLFPVEYPLFPKDKNTWITNVDSTLATIGTTIYRDTSFVLAVLGEEGSMSSVAYVLQGLTHDTGLLVPEHLFRQESVTPYGLHYPEGLWWTGGK